jgi:hypothetical protein
MNRENMSATSAGRPTARAERIQHHYMQKELCVVWLPERNSYLQGVTAHALYTIAEPEQATVFEGDDATRIAEQVIRCHGLKPVLRTHRGHVQ